MIKIKKASIKDIDKLAQLRLALQKELGEVRTLVEEQLMENATREYLQSALSSKEFISFIAEKDGEVVSASGLVLFKRPPYLENLQGIEAYILNMYTVPEFRGMGLASQLLECCIEESKTHGVKRIWLHATEAGKKVYTKLGFTAKYGKCAEMELFL